MDLYALTLEHLLRLRHLRDWPEAADLLRRAAARRDTYWRLPVLACQAVGGAPEQALPAMAAIASLQTGILLVDDMLDADPRGWYCRQGEAQAANLALALQAASTCALLGDAPESPAHPGAARSLATMALAVAHGQVLDARNPDDEPAYWRMVGLKSGAFFGAALEAGAYLGGAEPSTAAGLFALGHVIGEMIQLHDDVSDALATPANPDWLMGRLPLPILFAQTVPHPHQARFAALRSQAADTAALSEAQSILVSSGAVSYCVYHLQARDEKARRLLAALHLADRTGLAALLDELIAPVNDLLAVVAL